MEYGTRAASPLDYEDRIEISTPEGVGLSYVLAGVGSRTVAGLLDLLVQGGMLLALVVLVEVLQTSGSVNAIVLSLGSFLILYVYDVAFEVYSAGRTPGKRWTGLRVVMTSGRPISFVPSAIRNLVRLLEGPATLWIIAMAAILATKRNQRLGDLAGGTLVVRERRAADALGYGAPGVTVATAGNLDVSALGQGDVAPVRDFLARRADLAPAARRHLAGRLAEAVGPRVGGLPPGGLPPEQLLEAVVAAKERGG